MRTKYLIPVLMLMALPLTTKAYGQAEPLVVVALAKIKPGSEPIFREAVSKILASSRKEKGAISFIFLASTTSSTEFAFYEQWKSQEDLDTHLKSTHMQNFFKSVGPLFEAGFPSIKTYARTEK